MNVLEELKAIVNDYKGEELTIAAETTFEDLGFGSLVKVEVALCKGKQNYDKKRTIAERDQKRALDREIKNYR